MPKIVIIIDTGMCQLCSPWVHFVFGPCFVIKCLVPFLVLQSSP